MENVSALAAAEAMKILDYTEISLIAKIPYGIIRVLSDKASEYSGEINLDFSRGLKEQPISEEAQSILAVIYKDFWCDDKEQERLNEIIKTNEEEYEKELDEKYDPFKEENQVYAEPTVETEEKEPETTALVVQKKWYVRIFDRIVRFFRKK